MVIETRALSHVVSQDGIAMTCSYLDKDVRHVTTLSGGIQYQVCIYEGLKEK